MTRPVYKLLTYFKANRYREISLDWLISKSKGKTRGTILRYLREVNQRCPRGWRLLKTTVGGPLNTRWTFYTFCPSVEYFRSQQRIFKEAG